MFDVISSDMWGNFLSTVFTGTYEECQAFIRDADDRDQQNHADRCEIYGDSPWHRTDYYCIEPVIFTEQ